MIKLQKLLTSLILLLIFSMGVHAKDFNIAGLVTDPLNLDRPIEVNRPTNIDFKECTIIMDMRILKTRTKEGYSLSFPYLLPT